MESKTFATIGATLGVVVGAYLGYEIGQELVSQSLCLTDLLAEKDSVTYMAQNYPEVTQAYTIGTSAIATGLLGYLPGGLIDKIKNRKK